MLYYQSMHNKNWEEENDRKENTYLIRIYFFFTNFLVESYYLDHLLFKQAFFVKTFFFFYHFQHGIFFINNSFLFQICQFFFANFQITQKYFFEEDE